MSDEGRDSPATLRAKERVKLALAGCHRRIPDGYLGRLTPPKDAEGRELWQAWQHWK